EDRLPVNAPRPRRRRARRPSLAPARVFRCWVPGPLVTEQPRLDDSHIARRWSRCRERDVHHCSATAELVRSSHGSGTNDTRANCMKHRRTVSRISLLAGCAILVFTHNYVLSFRNDPLHLFGPLNAKLYPLTAQTSSAAAGLVSSSTTPASSSSIQLQQPYGRHSPSSRSSQQLPGRACSFPTSIRDSATSPLAPCRCAWYQAPSCCQRCSGRTGRAAGPSRRHLDLGARWCAVGGRQEQREASIPCRGGPYRWAGGRSTPARSPSSSSTSASSPIARP